MALLVPSRRLSAALVGVGLAAMSLSVPACGGGPPREANRSAEPAVRNPDGRSLFLSQCQSCHGLGALGTRRPVGGDLANYDMSAEEVRSFARIMPTPRPLTSTELAEVAEFVASVQRRAPEGPASRRGQGRGAGDSP